jgi:hypothetical protein
MRAVRAAKTSTSVNRNRKTNDSMALMILAFIESCLLDKGEVRREK